VQGKSNRKQHHLFELELYIGKAGLQRLMNLAELFSEAKV
jgi:hypothetical protein